MTMTNRIYLPPQLEKDLFNLVNQHNEVVGELVTLVEPSEDAEYIVTYHLTGEGSPSAVENDQNRTARIHRLMDGNPRIGHLHFHTHSKGTIQRHGNHYAYHFSGEHNGTADMEAIRQGKELEGNDYFELLFTYQPTNPPRLGVIHSEDRNIDLAIQDWEDDDGTPWHVLRERYDRRLGK